MEQQDVANPGLTVREALRFSAQMRQDPSIPLEQKYEYVEKVLSVCLSLFLKVLSFTQTYLIALDDGNVAFG